MRLRIASALYLSSIAVTLAHAQAPAASSESSPTAPTLTARSTLVLVPALVRNKSGQLVFALKADDFVLTDDGVPQKLHLEEDTGGEPLALVVLIEAGAAQRSAGWHPTEFGSSADRFQPLTAMMDAVVGDVPHKIAVVGFDSAPETLLNFTSDLDAATDAVHYLDSDIDGDGGAATLDALGYALDMLRAQPPQYRRAILLMSETNDRKSKLSLQEALRAISDTNTTIYSLAFSTGNTDASEYASRELPTKRAPCEDGDRLCLLIKKMESSHNKMEVVSGVVADLVLEGILLQNPNPGPAHGCMSASDPNAYSAKNPFVRAYDCAGQLLPPLAIAKVGAIAATEDMQRNVPETVARLTGGEYFKLSDAHSVEVDLSTIANHMHNRYILSFQPQSPHPGFHFLSLQLPEYSQLKVTSRNGYWAEAPALTHERQVAP